MINLDYICMKHAQTIANSVEMTDSKKAKELERNLRKALGILKEDGVYAMFLWLEDKAKETVSNLTSLLNEDDGNIKIYEYLLNNGKRFETDFDKFCENLKIVAQDIDKLLFMKKILERTLIYSLHHVKVKAGE
ncbi:MAG: hypothetical protein PWQ70_2766 [Clostridiales bacterium]|nr:hypothetical protein [Clostridiales bacterium]